jgi:excisionase family DNA binding protein
MENTTTLPIPVDLLYLDKHEAARYIGCSTRFINVEYAAGRLRGFHPRRKFLRFRLSDLDAYMQARQTANGS